MDTTAQISSSEDLGHGVTQEWIEDNCILVLTMPKNADRAAIDVWYERMVNIGDELDLSKPFLVMHNLQAMGFSQYFRDKSIELSKHTPDDIKGRGAVVLPRSIVGTLLSIAAQISGKRIRRQGFELKIFTDYNKALNWLKERL